MRYKLIRLFLLLFTGLLMSGLFVNEPHAACVHHEFEGTWTNVRVEKKTLDSLELETTCSDDGAQTKLKIRAFEKCHPRNCSWGWSEAVEIADGELIAVFNTFIAKRRLEISRFADRIRVRVIIDYINPAREDTDAAHIMVRRTN